MLKSRRAFYSVQTLLLDLLALFVAFVAAWFLRDSLGGLLYTIGDLFGYHLRDMVRKHKDLPPIYQVLLSTNPLIGFRNSLWIFSLAAPPWLFFLNAQRGYAAQSKRNARQDFALCAYAGLLGTVSLVVLLYLIGFKVSRLLLVNWMLLGIAILWLSRRILIPLLQRNSRRPSNLLFVGNRAAAEQFTRVLESPAYRSAHLLGYVSDEANDISSTRNAGANTNVYAATKIAHLGGLAALANILDEQVVDEVVLVRAQIEAAGNGSTQGDMLELCLQRGRTVSLIDNIVPPVGAKVEATTMGTFPTLVMHNTPQNTLGLATKSVMDRVLALLALIVFAPLLLTLAIIIKVTSPGPIFFKQKRVGLNGRQFDFYKFRSMIVDAEKYKEQHAELFAKLNTMSGPFFKSEDDPRITKIGRFIRKYSLDELPQFWNVLRGDMSLVGPRPPLPKEVAQLEPWQRRKLSVKGGLTCLWQVSGRNDITEVDEWMRLDLEYIDNWSLWLDVKLLFKTVQVLIKPKGAS